MFSPLPWLVSILGMEILLIAGPASVALDRARMLANFSTGKTGVILAETLRKHRQIGRAHV